MVKEGGGAQKTEPADVADWSPSLGCPACGGLDLRVAWQFPQFAFVCEQCSAYGTWTMLPGQDLH